MLKEQTGRTPLNELDKFMGGALQERVSYAIGQITANIFDPNTIAAKPRELVIKLTIKPNSKRNAADIITLVTTKLQPLVSLETSADIGYNQETGELTMVEKSDILPGQMNLLTEEEHKSNVAKFPIAKV